MKFQKFINEETEQEFIENSAKMIVSKCSKYLKEIVPNDFSLMPIMWSGRSESKKIATGDVRTDRRPKDMRQDLHNIIDEKFNKKFGFKARSNSVFVSGISGIAQSYGKLYSIYPIGDYKYVYSLEVNDLFASLQQDWMSDTKYVSWIDSILSNPSKEDIDFIKVEHYGDKNISTDKVMADLGVNNHFGDKNNLSIIKSLTGVKYRKQEWRVDVVDKWWKHFAPTYKTYGIKENLTKTKELMLNCKSYIMIKGLYDSEKIADKVKEMYNEI